MFKKKGLIICSIVLIILTAVSFAVVMIIQSQGNGLQVIEATGEEGSENKPFEIPE